MPRFSFPVFILIIFFISLTDLRAALADCAGLGEASAICQMLASDPDEEILPARAFGALSAFVHARYQGDLSEGAVDNALLKALPFEVQSRCKVAVQDAEKIGVKNGQILCFRPSCIAKDAQQTALCKPFQERVSELRKIFACAAGADCVSVSPEALEAILAADMLRDFQAQVLSDSEKGMCKGLTEEVCMHSLWDLLNVTIETYQAGARLHYIAQSISKSSLADQPGLINVIEDFERRWKIVEKKVQDEQSKESVTLFVLAPEVMEALGKVDSAAVSLRNQLTSIVGNRRIDAAKRILEAGNTLYAQASSNPLFVKFKADWEARGFANLSSDPTPSQAIELIRDFGQAIDNVGWALRTTAAIPPGVIPPPGNEVVLPCTGGDGGLNVQTGQFDMCYQAAVPTLPPGRIIGLRYAFVPCAKESEGDDCQYVGNLSLLVTVSTSDSTKKSTVAALGLGANSVRAHFDTDGVLRISSLVPRVSYEQVAADLQSLVDGLVPNPMISQVSEITLDDGPTLSFKLSVGTVLADTLSVKITVTPKGILVDDAALKDTLTNAVAEKVRVGLKGKSVKYGNDLSLTIDDAKITTSDPACLQRGSPELDLTVSIDSKIAGAPVRGRLYSCGNAFKIKLDVKQERLLNALVSKFEVARDNVKFFFLGDQPHALITLVTGGCVHEADVDILASTSTSLAILIKKFADDELKCHAGDFAAQADSLLKQLGFYETKDTGVYCTASIAEVGSICVRDVANPNHDTFSVVQDQFLKNRLSAKLQSVFGAGSEVTDISVTKEGIALTAKIDVPLLGVVDGVKVRVAAAGGSVGVDVHIYPALRAAINERAADYLKGANFKAAGVEVTDIALAGDDATVAVKGTISYGGIPAGIEIQVLPKLEFKPSAPAINLELLKQLLGPIGDFGGFNVSIGQDGIPVLTGQVKVSLPIEGVSLTAAATVRARAGRPLRFDGPVSFVLPGWYTISYVDIGRIRASLDMNKPLQNISLGASLALPKGDATYDVAAIDADLTIGPEEMTLKGSLSLLKIPLGQTVGVWKFKQGTVDIDVNGGAASDIIPLPSGHLAVDGPACAVVGTGSAKILGTKLLNVDAGLFLGKPCNAGTPKSQLVSSLIEKCGGRGPAGKLCLGGKASIGNILNAEGMLVSRLDQLIPRITGNIDLRDVAKFDVSVNAAQAAFRTKVLGFRVSLILPSVQGLNEAFLKRLIENLLKPSIDLSALAKGNITIAPASKGGSGDDATVPSGPDGKVPDNNGRVGPVDPVEPPPAPAQAGGTNLWEPGNATPSMQEIPGTGLARVMTTVGGMTFPKYWYAFQIDDAKILVAGKAGLPDVPTISKDGKAYAVACYSWPCKLDALQAMRIYETSSKADNPPSGSIKLNLASSEAQLLVEGIPVLAPANQSYFNFPPLVSYLADRELNGRASAAKIYCVRRDSTCRLALIVDQDRYYISDVGSWHMTELQEGSIARKVYAKACPSTPCNVQPLIDNLDALTSRSDLTAQGASADGALPTALVLETWKDGKTTRSLVKLGQNLEVLGTAPFDLFPSSRQTVEDSPISHPALSALVDAAAADLQPASNFQAETNLPNYAALLDSGAGTVWSSILTGEKACVRKSKTPDIAAKLAEWKENDFVNAAHAKHLAEAGGMRDLLSDFVHPVRSEAAFRMNPLLLQGDPTKDCPK